MRTTKAQTSPNVQSHQHHCYSLSGKCSSQPCPMLNFSFPTSLCSLAGWFEPYIVGIPEDRTGFLTIQREMINPYEPSGLFVGHWQTVQNQIRQRESAV